MDKPKNDPKNPKIFSTNEVAALIEDLKGEFRSVVEVVSPLSERMDKVENRLGVLETKVDTLSDAVRVALPSLNQRVSKLEAKIGA